MFRSFHSQRRVFLLEFGCMLLLLSGLLALQPLSQALAKESKHTLYVGSLVGTNSGCSSPGYTSVQAAVDAAKSDDTVYLCTTFAEQVIISKELTLTGKSGAGIVAPAVFPHTALNRLPPQFASDNLFIPEALLIVWGAKTQVSISNLTISGVLPTNGGCANEEYGVLVIDGATVSIDRDQVKNIRDSNPALYGCQFGVGVQIGREYWPDATFATYHVENFVGHASITNTLISGYQKNGLTVDGPGSTSEISKNAIQGAGRDALLAPVIAQNGVQISRGASASVEENFIIGNSYTGTAYASAAGVIVFGGCGDPLVTHVEVAENTLLNNDVGIYLNNYTADCSAPAAKETNDQAQNNYISNNAVTNMGDGTSSGFPYKGYQVGIDDIGNHDTITGNTISGAGYTPSRTTPGGPYVMPIDTTSFPTIDPTVRDNHIR